MPELHAELVEMQISFKLSKFIIASPVPEGNVIFKIPGRRIALPAFIEIPSMLFFNRLTVALTSLACFLFSCDKILIFSSSAYPIATIPGTFSVPARLDASWAPPNIKFGKSIPFLIYAKPLPFNPLNLCADAVRKSMFNVFKSIGMWPTDCTASV